ncbi:MAG: redoxin domain-containing protein [Candidatus Latescibacterota bacterium]|nr:redoxin domain-containing protein [Candidatus Latescibacterota bacterium]
MEIEQAGSAEYQIDHMAKLFEEGFSFSGFERDKLYLNRGGNFDDVSGVSGIDDVGDGRGAAYGDFDNDGDADLFLTTLQGQVHHLFRNNVGDDLNSIRIDLRGTDSGPDAFATIVRVKTSHGIQTRVKAGGSGFVSQGDPRLLFGLGTDSRAEWIEVTWPSGAMERRRGVAAGSRLLWREGAGPEEVSEVRFDLPDPTPGGVAGLRVALGSQFPDIAVQTLAGEATDFSAFRQPGRRYLVNLWATWCIPCRQEMPELERLYPALQAAGFELLGISLDTGAERDRVPKFLKRLGITYPVVTTDTTAFRQLYDSPRIWVPLSVIVDADGMVEELLSGWSAQTERRIHDLIAETGSSSRPPHKREITP